MSDQQFHKSMLKSEYAAKIGCTRQTLCFYCNKLLIDKLKELNYRKDQKYLTPRQIAFLDKELVVV